MNKPLLIIAIFLTQSACMLGGNTESVSTSGSVGDGPIVNATVQFISASGEVVHTTRSDNTANFQTNFDAKGSDFPLLVVAKGGTDVVSGTEPDFTLLSAVTDPGQSVVNISPVTTLIVRTAQCLPHGLDEENLEIGRELFLETTSFGWDSNALSDPITSDVNANNVAMVVATNEALAETVRRTITGLGGADAESTTDELIRTLSCDLSNGFIDGRGGDANPQAAATFTIASAGVLAERLEGKLMVNGTDATLAMDFALNLTEPTTPSSVTIADVPLTGRMLWQTRAALSAAHIVQPAKAIEALATTTANLTPGTSLGGLGVALSPEQRISLADAIGSVSTASSSLLEAVNLASADDLAASNRELAKARGVYPLWYGSAENFTGDLAYKVARGGQIMLQWRDVEPTRGNYDFSRIDELLSTHSDFVQGVTIQINNTFRPSYLDMEVPWTEVPDGPVSVGGRRTHMYWHPTYIDRYRALIVALGAHLKASPHRDLIVGIRQNFNAIRTEAWWVPKAHQDPFTLWHTPEGISPGAIWTPEIGRNYNKQVITAYVEAFAPDILVFLRRDVLDMPDVYATWFKELLRRGNVGLFHTSSNVQETDFVNIRKGYGHFKDWCDEVPCYAEQAGSSLEGTLGPAWASPDQANYWRLLADLSAGVDYVAVYAKELCSMSPDNGTCSNVVSTSLRDRRLSFDFVNRYAGQKKQPTTSPGAWVAFRGGTNLPGDYGFLMSRVGHDTTMPLIDIGPRTQCFGAHAREFSADTALELVLDGAFEESLVSPFEVRVTYLDNNTGSFEVHAFGNSYTERMANSGRWRTFRFLIREPTSKNNASAITITPAQSTVFLIWWRSVSAGRHHRRAFRFRHEPIPHTK